MAERLILQLKCRVKATHLSSRACHRDEVDCLSQLQAGVGAIRIARVLDRLLNCDRSNSKQHPLARGQMPIHLGSISQSVFCASSSRLAGQPADFSPRPLPWLAARLEDAPCYYEPRWLADPDPPWLVRLLPEPNVGAQFARHVRGKVRLASCHSSLIRMCDKRRPLNPQIERATRPLQYIREMAQTGQASDRFSALTLPRILSVLSSKETF